jgi:hypothetical protein
MSHVLASPGNTGGIIPIVVGPVWLGMILVGFVLLSGFDGPVRRAIKPSILSAAVLTLAFYGWLISRAVPISSDEPLIDAALCLCIAEAFVTVSYPVVLTALVMRRSESPLKAKVASCALAVCAIGIAYWMATRLFAEFLGPLREMLFDVR